MIMCVARGRSKRSAYVTRLRPDDMRAVGRRAGATELPNTVPTCRGGHPADVAARDSGRDGRSKREMEVTEAKEFETGVVCV